MKRESANDVATWMWVMRTGGAKKTLLTCVVLAAAVFCLASGALATPPPPPGGHNPIYFGGSNAGGYPALSPTSVPELGGASEGSALLVTTAPNPFTKSTVFRFTLRASEEAQLRIYSAAGRQVREMPLVAQSGGQQTLFWDGKDDEGRRLPSGVYLYRLDAGKLAASGKLVFLE